MANELDQFNVTQAGTLPPELYAQQQQLNRQQQLASMLMQNNQQPQGQMISGRYVKPNFFQALQPVANMITGAYLTKQGDQKNLALAEQLRQNRINEATDIMKASNPDEQLKSAISGYSPLAQNIASKLIERKFKDAKWEKVEKLDAHGNTVTGFIDVNSSSPESTFRPLGVSKPAVSAAEAARLRDEGIPYGGGGYNTSAVVPSNVPASNNGVVTTSSNMPASNAAVASSNISNGSTGNIPMTPIVNMNGVSPKEQRAIKTKQLEDTQANVKNAYEVFSVVKQIEDTLPKAHGSGIGNIVGGAYNFVGADNPKNEADAQLKILGSKLLMQVPRFQGPQSDKDVATYKEAAGQIGDPTIPANVRMAALKTIKELNARYAPNLDWGLVKPTPIPNAPKTQASPAPAGVPADVWAVMTPQEKALWK
jgi:hypothetical protein